MKKVRLLIIDDSLFMRRTLSRLLTTPDIEIVGTASNGKEGIEKVLTLNPDVVTLDIEMPVMNGLEALKIIMEKKPLPVLMVSTLTSAGAEATVEALANGAMDFITKKQAFTEMHTLRDELIGKVMELGSSSSVRQHLIKRNAHKRFSSISKTKTSVTKDPTKATRPAPKSDFPVTGRPKPGKSDVKIIGLGISTGGPYSLHEIIPKISPDLPVSILVVQHMPPYFTKTLAQRLDGQTTLTVKEAEDGERIQKGTIYIAPGGWQMTLNKRNKLIIEDGSDKELFKPSVNVMMNSIVDVHGAKAVGIIMTGMGNDGAVSFKKLHDAGGYIITQDPNTCVVAGMPTSVIKQNIADDIKPLNDIASTINSLFGLKTV